MDALRIAINEISTPTTLYVGSSIIFFLAMWKMEWVVKPIIAGSMALIGVFFFVFALFDAHFRSIVLKPDNIPITIMLVAVGYLSWYALWKAVRNDQRIADGKPVLEKEQNKRTMVWPNLVYIEFIALIGMLIFLIVWSILFQAPLEEPANLTLTPNPSKAPWYFLGLQEMLVYFDPWLAGVVFPGLIVLGLMALPYLDKNPKGNGYYSFKERKFIIGFYLFGFVIQWVLLIMMGTFMRGPGWNFFGPFEPWDPHKVEALTNINLSEIVWVQLINTALPTNILVREAPGFVLIGLYFFALPMFLPKLWGVRQWFGKFREQLTPVAYYLAAFLFLSFVLLPIKMVLRWTLNLKYVVAIPEYFFNI